MPVKMELCRVLIRETDGMHVIELREADIPEEQARVFPIVIGLTEAAAIERRLMGQIPPRPQTHELLDSVIAELGYTLARIEIVDLREHTFFARIRLKSEANTLDLDARPSDAIALGALYDTPIYVAEHVIEEVTRAPF